MTSNFELWEPYEESAVTQSMVWVTLASRLASPSTDPIGLNATAAPALANSVTLLFLVDEKLTPYLISTVTRVSERSDEPGV